MFLNFLRGVLRNLYIIPAASEFLLHSKTSKLQGSRLAEDMPVIYTLRPLRKPSVRDIGLLHLRNGVIVVWTWQLQISSDIASLPAVDSLRSRCSAGINSS